MPQAPMHAGAREPECTDRQPAPHAVLKWKITYVPHELKWGPFNNAAEFMAFRLQGAHRFRLPATCMIWRHGET